MNTELYQLLLSLKLGDGCFVNQRRIGKPTYYVKTNAINHDYVHYKESVLHNNGISTRSYFNKSGYGSNKVQYGINTRIEPEVTIVGRMSIDDAIEDLDIFGLCLYYLDDGSLHKSKYFMHLYSNSLTYEQTEKLIDKFYTLFPIKRCKHRLDKKKDGRQFTYIYIPRAVAEPFSLYVRSFLIQNNINSLLYKTIPPSQTIESIV